MFVYSLRGGTVKFVGVVCVALTVLITLIAFVPTYELGNSQTAGQGEVEYSYDKIKTAEDAANFLSQFGWKVEAKPVEVKKVTIPKEFDKVFAAYNEIQKGQGLNLLKFRNKEVTRYCFSVTNYPGYEGTVYANLLVYRNKIIGGDICSADVSGFIHGFESEAQKAPDGTAESTGTAGTAEATPTEPTVQTGAEKPGNSTRTPQKLSAVG